MNFIKKIKNFWFKVSSGHTSINNEIKNELETTANGCKLHHAMTWMTILLLDRWLSDETFGSNKKLILGLLLNFKYTWSFNNFQCVKFWIKFWISSFKSILGNSISLLKEVLLVLSQPGRVGDALLNALFRPIRCPEYIFQDNKISRISYKPLDFQGSNLKWPSEHS